MAVQVPGEQVETLRKAMGLSVAQFASVLGVHPSSVHRWEAAGQGPATVDGVAAGVLVAMSQRLQGDRKARQEAGDLGDAIAKALLVGGALVGLALLLKWLTSGK